MISSNRSIGEIEPEKNQHSATRNSSFTNLKRRATNSILYLRENVKDTLNLSNRKLSESQLINCIEKDNHHLLSHIFDRLIAEGESGFVNLRLRNGLTLAHLACRHGSLECLKFLVKIGANLKLASAEGNNKTCIEFIEECDDRKNAKKVLDYISKMERRSRDIIKHHSGKRHLKIQDKYIFADTGFLNNIESFNSNLYIQSCCKLYTSPSQAQKHYFASDAFQKATKLVSERHKYSSTSIIVRSNKEDRLQNELKAIRILNSNFKILLPAGIFINYEKKFECSPLYTIDILQQSLYYYLHIKREIMAIDNICDILFDSYEALDYLHDNNLTHNAFSSFNVVLLGSKCTELKNNFKAKLKNFEYSTMMYKKLQNNCEKIMLFDRKYFNFYSPWLSPELLDYQFKKYLTISPESDWFSFGVLAYELATRKFPQIYSEVSGQKRSIDIIDTTSIRDKHLMHLVTTLVIESVEGRRKVNIGRILKQFVEDLNTRGNELQVSRDPSRQARIQNFESNDQDCRHVESRKKTHHNGIHNDKKISGRLDRRNEVFVERRLSSSFELQFDNFGGTTKDRDVEIEKERMSERLTSSSSDILPSDCNIEINRRPDKLNNYGLWRKEDRDTPVVCKKIQRMISDTCNKMIDLKMAPTEAQIDLKSCSTAKIYNSHMLDDTTKVDGILSNYSDGEDPGDLYDNANDNLLRVEDVKKENLEITRQLY